MSDEEVSRELGPNYISPCFQLTFEADIRIAKKRILKSSKANVIDRIIVKTETTIKRKLNSSLQGIFCCEEHIYMTFKI